MRRSRKQSGATLVLVLTIIGIVVIVGVGAIMFMQLFAGQELLQQAADSGTLAAARNVLTGINATLGNGDPAQFEGVAAGADPSTGVGKNINLINYNRVMGQAFLVSANAQAMVANGQDGGSAASHAKQLVDAANTVADALTSQLTQQQSSAVQGFFSALASLNPTAGAAGNGGITASSTIQTSFMNQGDPSNLYITPAQMPDADYTQSPPTSSMLNSSWTTSVTGASGTKYALFKGYTSGIAPSSTAGNIFFIPLRPGTQPRVLNASSFNANTNPTSFGWQDAVPNALGISSAATNGGASQGFSAYALIEPISPVEVSGSTPPSTFAASIPHGFIRFKNGPSSPATGTVPGSSNGDVFSYCMDHPQYFVTDASGKALPYFIDSDASGSSLPMGATSAFDYLQKIIAANNAGAPADCSGLNVGYALSGDSSAGSGGGGTIAKSNCSKIMGADMNGGSVGTYQAPSNNGSSSGGSSSGSSGGSSSGSSGGSSSGSSGGSSSGSSGGSSSGSSGPQVGTMSGGSAGQGYNNTDLDNVNSAINTAMNSSTNFTYPSTYTAELVSRHLDGNGSPPQGPLYGVPMIENAQGIQPPQTVTSPASVHVVDQITFYFLSARSNGNDVSFANFFPIQSGISDFPSGTSGRPPLASGNYNVSYGYTVPGNFITATNTPTLWNYLLQRCYEINPNFTGASQLSTLLQAHIPLGTEGYIYMNNSGTMVLESIPSGQTAPSDAGWLGNYLSEMPDGQVPTNPTDMWSGGTLVAEPEEGNTGATIDVDGDWNFPHPFDGIPGNSSFCVVNWYAWTPSSGWHNLLGEVTMGAFGMICGACPYDAAHYSTFTIQPNGTGGNMLSMPTACGGCPDCTWTGPC